MTANTQDPKALAEFEAFLDVHGPNRSRWPAQKRLQFAPLITSSADARRLLAEASALERLIGTVKDDDDAGQSYASHTALTDRIVMAALAESAAAKPAAFSAPIAVSAPTLREEPRKIAPATSNVTTLRPAPRHARAMWRLGAMMAASLLLGITMGVTTMSKLNSGAELASTETASDAAIDPAVIALDNDSFGPLGGELL